MSAALNYAPHPDYTEGSKATEQPKYIVPEGQKTKGEKLYDFMNYHVVGYGAVLALSLVITDLFMHGPGKPIKEATEKPFADFLSKFIKPDTAKTMSEAMHKYAYLTSGGTVLMAPMLWAENRKTKLTYLANRKYSPQVIAADDPFKDLSAREILSKDFDENKLAQPVEEQPKHGVGNALWRRALGVATITAIWAPLSTKIFGENKISEFGTKIGKKALEATHSDKLIEISKTPVFERYAGWTMDDGINTVITAGLLKATNGAKSSKHKKENSPEAEQPVAPIEPQMQPSQPADYNERVLVQDNAADRTMPGSTIQSPQILANQNIEHAMQANAFIDEAEKTTQLAPKENHVEAVHQRSDQNNSLSV